MQPAQSAAKVTVNGRHHFSFHQRLTQGAAGFKRRIIGSVGADHALTHEVQPRALEIVRAVVDEALHVLRRVAEKQPNLVRKLSALASFERLLVSIL